MDLLNISSSPEWNFILNLLLNDKISEVQANGPNEFFIKESGRRKYVNGINFVTDKDYIESIKTGLVPHVKTFAEFDELGYIFEGPLRYVADGKEIRGRCHIVLPPAADHPQVTIAKKSTSLATLDSICASGSMAEEMKVFMKAAAAADLSIVFSGGTGAGKTTFLEAFTKELSSETRIGVAEDTPELVLNQKNVSYLHSNPWRPGMDEKDIATLSWVVAQFNRMRTDKLIIGETRGKEFADFLIAANSGMDGSLTTLHANDPVSALEKMTNLALKGAPNLNLRSINQDIAKSLDLVVQLEYFKGDSRYRMTAIEEITNTVSDKDSASITTARLYSYDKEKDSWTKDMNCTDNLRRKFAKAGVDIVKLLPASIGETLYPMGVAQPRQQSGLPARRI